MSNATKYKPYTNTDKLSNTLNSIAKTIKNKHAANYFGIYFTLNFSKSREMKRRAKRDCGGKN